MPIGMHIDHTQEPDIIRRPAYLGGFDCIIVDMSLYEREENMRLSRELIEYCNACGIITERKTSHINDTEHGIQDSKTEKMSKESTTGFLLTIKNGGVASGAWSLILTPRSRNLFNEIQEPLASFNPVWAIIYATF